jgi:hypothetical protein
LRELVHPFRCVAGIERRIEVDRTGQLEQRGAALPRLRVEQPLGPVEPPSRYPRQCLELLARQAARGEVRLDRALRQPPEGDELAARANRGRKGSEIVGNEDDDGVIGRFFEVLEERVGGVLVHQMRAENQVDATGGLEGPHVQVPAQVADRVDADLVTQGLEHVEIGMGATGDSGGVPDERSGEREGGAPLADAARPVEEVRVRGALGESSAQQRLRLVLFRKGLEGVHG